jgi:hypothetical protein
MNTEMLIARKNEVEEHGFLDVDIDPTLTSLLRLSV